MFVLLLVNSPASSVVVAYQQGSSMFTLQLALWLLIVNIASSRLTLRVALLLLLVNTASSSVWLLVNTASSRPTLQLALCGC